MSPQDSETVRGWIQQFREGDQAAASDLWQQYFARVAAVARKRLGDLPRRVIDEEDVALSVMRCLCEGAGNGRFDDVTNHDDLWRLLLTITRQKSVDYVRYASRRKRGGAEVRGESALVGSKSEGAVGFDLLMSDEPTPEFVVEVDEQFRRLLKALPDQIPREILLHRLSGWSVDEIADELEISTHAVRRKLKLARTIWRDISERP